MIPMRGYVKGAELISDYRKRPDWSDQVISDCKGQWADWLAIRVTDPRFRHYADLPACRLWTALASSRRWSFLWKYAEFVLSLPAAETENERVFSIRKHVIVDRGGRSKNDIVTTRVGIRMEQTRRNDLKDD
jgi:hypothetical protein